MARLPADLDTDPTLEAADAAMLARNAREHRTRGYLGMSGLGSSCDRNVWGVFRWVGREDMDAVGLRRIEDGFAGEEVQADRLAAVPGLVLITAQRGGGQLSVGSGHVRGHVDGIVLGLLQSPGTWHVWEHKQSGEKVIARLEKCRAELGEGEALREWNLLYYTQAQLYMLSMHMDRHYLTVASPGGRRTISIRTKLDRAFAVAAMKRGQDIALAPVPAGKLQPHDRACFFCPLKENCHAGKMPNRSCRTCISSTPTAGGEWRCEKHGVTLTLDQQLTGCADQRLIPDLVPAEQVDADPAGAWIEYEFAGAQRWRDEGPTVPGGSA